MTDRSPHQINCLIPRQPPTPAVLRHFKGNALSARSAGIHEAAHAVVYTVVGAQVEEIRLIATCGEGYAAETELDPSITPEQHSVGVLAGVAMDSLLWIDCTGHIRSDTRTAFDTALWLNGVRGPTIGTDEINAALDRMHADWVRAMELVTRPRNFLAIQRVAKHALKCETIDGATVRSLVANTTGHPSPNILKAIRVIRQRVMERDPPYTTALEDYLTTSCTAVSSPTEARRA
jgi:hypothetical protein